MKESETRLSAPEMYDSSNLFPQVRFTTGELYLFHPCQAACPPEGSLWGIFDRRSGASILLETSSADLKSFARWHPLLAHYRFCRLATRAELRDYTYNLCCSERLLPEPAGVCG